MTGDFALSLENQEKIETYLTLLIEHEKKISELYRAYAQEFPAVRVFWQRLCNEEMQHAKCIETLAESGELSVRECFPAEAVQTSIHYVQKLIEEVPRHSHTLLNAVSLSLNLEVAMIENQFFEVFKGDSDELAEVFRTLTDQTREHLGQIREMLAECKIKP